MRLEKMIKNIKNVNGYAGSSILNNEGEILYIDESRSIDIAFASSLFNDTFRALKSASVDVGFSRLIRLEGETKEGMIFLIYSNSRHTIFSVFNPECNISLAKIMLIQSLKRDA
jgi:hypothetical protein